MSDTAGVPQEQGASRYVQYRQIAAELAACTAVHGHPAPFRDPAAADLAARTRRARLEELEDARRDWAETWGRTNGPQEQANLHAHQPRILEPGAGLVCITCTAGGGTVPAAPAPWPCAPFQQTARASGA